MAIPTFSGPSYIPAGFAFSYRVPGLPGLGRVSDQVALVYARSGDRVNRLFIHIGPRNAQSLTATELHEGKPVDFGDPSVIATYHDGWWELGEGPNQRPVGNASAFVHWETANAHSITVRRPAGTVAVRGFRAAGITFDDLVQIARTVEIR